MTKPKDEKPQDQTTETGSVAAALVRAAGVEAEHFQIKAGKAEEHQRALKHGSTHDRRLHAVAEKWARIMQWDIKQAIQKGSDKKVADVARDALLEVMPEATAQDPSTGEATKPLIAIAKMVKYLSEYWQHGKELSVWKQSQTSVGVTGNVSKYTGR
jgi:hypothetical protein